MQRRFRPPCSLEVMQFGGHLQHSRHGCESLFAGFHYPKMMIEPAQRELDGFAALLQSLGIVVRRPEAVDHRKRFSTPQWSSRGFCNSCPRDSLLVNWRRDH
jgi:hypothetical protein